MNKGIALGMSALVAAALLGSATVIAQPSTPVAVIERLTTPQQPVTVAGNYDSHEAPLVQIALLLDTSNSMDGLIDQAKSQLWRIVGAFGKAHRRGVSPRLEVALYEYGKSSLPGEEGYLRMIVPMGTDLDRVSEELFKLTTNGGEEYCGWVIKEAVQGLSWSHDKDALKLIFIAGNEPFTQGPKDFHDSVRSAVDKDIVVNTIFCGPYNDGVATAWKDGAVLGNGRYVAINQDYKAAQVDAPQDKEIARLGSELNRTYIPYGAKGKEGHQRQQAQDAAASGVSNEMNVQRSAAKANSQYSNTTWDMGDAVKDGVVKVENVKEEDLPAEMKGMSAAQKRAYVQKKLAERQKIQTQIQQLNSEREKYILAQAKKNAGSPTTLDSAMIQTVREEAAKKSIDF